MWAGASPAIIGVPRRSTWDEDRALGIAIESARGNIHPAPVIHGGKIIAVVRGEDFYSPVVRYKRIRPGYRFNYSNYDDLISEFVTKGKFYQAVTDKALVSSATIYNWFDMWTAGSVPTAATLGGAAATANAYDDTNASASPHGGNVSPDTKYLLSITGQSLAPVCFLFYDRVLDYQSCAYTAAINQAMTNVAVAGRYASAGTPGCQLTWGADTAHDATASAITALKYTNQAGTLLQAMQTTPQVDIIVSGAASSSTLGTRLIAPAITATTVPFGAFLPLAQGDTGARLVDNYTTSAANTGTFVLALVYPLAYAPLVTLSGLIAASQIDQLFHISAMERIYDGACISFMLRSGTSGNIGRAQASLTYGWG